MAKIKTLDEIESITVHWSESNLINDDLGCDENCDIEKTISPTIFDDLIVAAARLVSSGYDKNSLTVRLKNGDIWCKSGRFNLHSNTKGLLQLLNHRE